MSGLLTYLQSTPAVAAAAIAAVIAATVSALTLIVTPYSQRAVEAAKAELQKEIEDYKRQLGREMALSNARLAYEFEARKHLYVEVEPMLFQLFEASEQSYYRVVSLVRTARSAQLDGEAGWLAREGYYLHSSLYWLLAPLAIFRNLQRKATFFDLRLDESVRLRYLLLKFSYLGFTDDFLLAAREPPLPYDPNRIGWRDLRARTPATFWRQGFILGHLDRLTEAMVITENGSRRVMTFGEFQARIRSDADFKPFFAPAIDLLLGFSFEARPVLARLLLAQAVFHRLILFSYAEEATIPRLHAALLAFVDSPEFARDLAWWGDGGASPAAAVRDYVKERLDWLASDDYAIAGA